MIKSFRLLRNIGQFDSVDEGAHIELGQLTLCYAENGRGKTTLASILRSLADGNTDPITVRSRFGSSNDPHVVIAFADGGPHSVFKNGTWNNPRPSVVVFDDLFVEQNVYSGLTVSPHQRQNLHDLVIGPQAVALQNKLKELTEKVEDHGSTLRHIENEIPRPVRGTLSIKDFCELPPDPSIDQTIQDTESLLAAAGKAHLIADTPVFDIFDLPKFDLGEIQCVLNLDLDSLEKAAFEQVQHHLTCLGHGGEQWVSDGMHRIGRVLNGNAVSICPFCAQSLEGSFIIGHYQEYFSKAYTDLKHDISEMSSAINAIHGERVRAEFERWLRVASERRQFWVQYCDVEELTLDTSEICSDLHAAREAILAILATKQACPLDKETISEVLRNLVATYEGHRSTIAGLMQRIEQANIAICQVKNQLSSIDVQALSDRLARCKMIKARHTDEISTGCSRYLEELKAKSETESERDQVRDQLDLHRGATFAKYGVTVNRCLERFGADYHLVNLKHGNLRTGSTSTYDIQVGDESIAIGRSKSAPTEPSFGSVLSSGDRSTLAFALFLASLDQRDNLKDTIVVIDDPISSMDGSRSLTTVQAIRALAYRAKQVIVLSHDKGFLSRISECGSPKEFVALEIARVSSGSTLREWNIAEDSLTLHDRRHKLFQEYLQHGTGDKLEIARGMRLHLEGFLRTAVPQYFPPRSMLGPFLIRCQQYLDSGTAILPETRVQDLREITEYANRFHHDTNRGWTSEQITDGELRTFVERTLKFAKP